MTNTMKRLAVLLIGTLFILCVAIVLAVSLPVSTAFAAEGEPEVTIHDHADGWTELTAAGGTIGEGSTAENPALYYLTSDVTLTTDITVADNATVTLCLNGYKLTGAGTSAVITVGAGADFTLEDCSADASAPAGRGVITCGIGFLDEYSARHGGGVYISGNSTFTMNGGTISGNTATFGGGVGVDNDGTFTMNGGTISGNTANFDGGGVYAVGTFTMTGGTIGGNTAKYGGGVYAEGAFTMKGGTISGNTAEYGGGGVCVAWSGTFTMTGGTIAGNVAEAGGGVYVDGGTFTMNGGAISGNTVSYAGGGVCVAWSGTFTMTDGIISGNTAEYGGGVYVSGRTFTMEGGAISGNTASKDGGGVYVEGGTFTMKDGAITNNIASNNNNKRGGGGVFVGGTFTMEGGTISGNTATNGSGGGVNVYNSSDSMFNMTGGYLGDNTATESGNDIYKDEAGVVSISGGYFSENPDAAYIADGHTAQDISALGGATFDGDYKDGFPYAVYAQGGILISTNKDIVYDGSPVAEGVDFTVEGTDGVTLTYSYKVESDDEFTAGLPTNAGDYTVYVYALNGEKQFISMVFDITIAKATYDMSGITFADDRVTYDGEAHSIEIAGTLPDGVSVSYDVSYKVNAGEYTVTATFTGDSANYNAIPDMTAKLTIAKADYDMSDITFEDGSFTYDGQAHSLVISGTLPTGVSVTYAGNDKTNAGEYTVTATFVGDYDNYIAIPDITATLTIAKAAPAYTAPTDLTVVAEGTLADIALPDGWAWKITTPSRSS